MNSSKIGQKMFCQGRQMKNEENRFGCSTRLHTTKDWNKFSYYEAKRRKKHREYYEKNKERIRAQEKKRRDEIAASTPKRNTKLFFVDAQFG